MVCGRLFATLFHITPPGLVSSLPSDLNLSKWRAGWELAPKKIVSAHFWPDYYTTSGLSTRVESDLLSPRTWFVGSLFCFLEKTS